MKNILLSAVSVAALLATAPVAQAETHFKSGFKVGAGAGYKHSKSTTKAEWADRAGGVVGANDESFSTKGRGDSAQVELHAGYDYIIGRFLAAVDVDYRYAPGSKTKASFQTNQANLGAGEAPFQTTVNHNHDFGLSVNLGGLVTENFALYAIGNVRLGRFKLRFAENKPAAAVADDASKSRSLWGVGGGLGGRYVFKNGISVALHGTYDVYQKIRIKDNLSVGGNDAFFVQTKNPHVVNVIFRVTKKI